MTYTTLTRVVLADLYNVEIISPDTTNKILESKTIHIETCVTKVDQPAFDVKEMINVTGEKQLKDNIEKEDMVIIPNEIPCSA